MTDNGTQPEPTVVTPEPEPTVVTPEPLPTEPEPHHYPWEDPDKPIPDYLPEDEDYE